jgi:hypothetical protein
MMINKWMIGFLLLFSMNIHLLGTELKATYYAKKGIKITWYGAQTLIGAGIGMLVLEALLANNIDRDVVKAGGIAVPTLLYQGISGLNEELALKKHAQKLYKKYMKREKIDEDNHETH